MAIDNAESLISAAVAEATGGDEGGSDESTMGIVADDSSSDGGEVVASGDDTGTEGEAVAAAEGDGLEAVEVAETPEQTAAREQVEKDDALLASIGFQQPKEGRDNRIPHSRVRKMLLTGLEKHTAPLRTELEGLKTEVPTLREAKATMDRLDAMIGAGDERLIQWLATQNPAFQKFVGGAKADPAPMPETFTDPMPGPDAQDKDGNPMYTPAQWEKFTQWQAAKAEFAVEKKLRADMDKRLGPYEKQAKAAAAYQERAARIKAEVEDVKATWGDLLPADGSKEARELMGLMTQNPKLTFAQAAAKYILPKLRTDRNAMRASILAELRKAPAKVKGSVPGQGTKTEQSETGPRGTEDVIRQSLRDAGLTQN